MITIALAYSKLKLTEFESLPFAAVRVDRSKFRGKTNGDRHRN